MFNLRNIVLVLLALGVYFWFSSPKIAPQVSLDVYSNDALGYADSCQSKERCVVVYMAPWCSACKQGLPLVQALRDKIEQSSQVGFKIIIGRAEVSELESFAEEIGGKVFIDSKDTFYKEIKGRGVPGWWVWDRTGKILINFSGTYVGASMPQLVKKMVEEKLQVSEFL